jgi:sulfur relay protein TusB/DsrH
MSRLCLLLMTTHPSKEESDRMIGLLSRARERNWEGGIYLLGDGVYYAKKGQQGHVGTTLRHALQKGAEINAKKQDLLARALSPEQVESDVNILDDFEGVFVDDIMETADRVISW